MTTLLALTIATLSAGRYDWLWGLGVLPVVALAALWLAAVISIIGSRYGWGAKLLFIFGTLSFPFLGPLLWFFSVRSKSPRDAR